MQNILVLGGSGFIGRSLCEALVERSGGGGGRIIVPSRRPHRAGHLRTLPTVEVIYADVHDDTGLAQLVTQADAVINLVAILHGSASAFEKAHVTLPQRLARACLNAGVRRLVHVSALGVSDDAGSAPSNYLRTKGLGETALRSAPGLDLTILRPSVVFGEHDRFVNLFAKLQTMAPVLALAGCHAQFQPVWVKDVAAAIVHCLDHDETIGQTIECAGPQVMSLREIVRWAGIWSGHPRPIFPLPMGLGYLQGLVLELIPGEPLMSRDNVLSMMVPNVASGRLPGLRQIGITPTAMASVMQAILGHQQGPGRMDAWRKASG